MKKTIVSSLLLAAMLFCACSSDSNGITNDEPQKKRGMKLNAIVPDNLCSRATIGNTEDNTWTFAFSNGDQAKVTNSNMSSYYTFTKSVEEFSSTEAEPTSTPANWYAYFPSTEISLTNQTGSVADVANKFALAGKTSSPTTGDDGLTIHMNAKVAVLVIDNKKGSIDINIKNSATTWVTGLTAKNGTDEFDVVESTTPVSVLNKSENGKYYIAVPAGVQLAIKNGNNVIKSTVEEGLEAGKYYTVEIKQEINGHEYVEIGGKKWATMNVGATTVAGSPSTCFGDYFARGETTPRYTGITYNSASSLTFAGWKTGYGSGYNLDSYPTYTGSTLDAAHDAARQNWGGTWRTPTHQEFLDLYNACGGTGTSIESTTVPKGTKETTAKGIYFCDDYDGVAGLLFSDGTNKVFFPANGQIIGKAISPEKGTRGCYWSSNLATSTHAYGLDFDTDMIRPSNQGRRSYGRTVRPVSD